MHYTNKEDLETLLLSMTDTEIADMFKVTKQTIEYFRKKFDLPSHREIVNSGIDMPDKDTLEDLLRTMNDHEIADLYHVDHAKIARLRYSYGLPQSSTVPRHFADLDITESQLRELVTTMNDRMIAEQFSVGESTILRLRSKYGIPASNVVRTHSTYTFNKSFFHVIDTKEKAYVLGFVCADGHVDKTDHYLAIRIKKTDESILYDIRDAMQGNQPIYFRKASPSELCPGATDQSSLTFFSTQMVADLRSLGILHNKTEDLTLPEMPSHLYSHFLRGFIDGDGYICKGTFGMVVNDTMLPGVKSLIQNQTGCLLRETPKKSIIQLWGSKRDKPVLDWAYNDSSLCLQRKKEKYLQYWN
jgi:hypothetical protein